MLSHDGTILASGPVEKEIRFWDLRTDRLLRRVIVPEGFLHAMSQDGQRLALRPRSDCECIVICDAQSGQTLHRLKAGAFWVVLDAAFAPDGRTVAIGLEPWPELYEFDDCRETVELWDAASGSQLRRLEGAAPDPTDGPGVVRSVAFSPDSKILAWGARGAPVPPTIKLWDVATGDGLRTLVGLSGPIDALAFSPDGGMLASGDEDGIVALWNVALWNLGVERKPHRLLGHEGGVNAVAFSPDGRFLASASEDRTVRIWDIWSGGVALQTLTGHGAGVCSVAYWPDGQTLASEAADNTVKIWDAVSALELMNFNPWTK
jgi:WD40 repeat protein